MKANRGLWIAGIALLIVTFGLGFAKGSAHESFAESLGGGVGTVVGAVAIACIVRLVAWLVQKRKDPFFTPWILVIAGVLGPVSVIGTTASDREERREASEEAALEAAACQAEVSGPRLAVAGLRVEPFDDPALTAALEQNGVGAAVDFFSVSDGGRRPLGVVGLMATGGDGTAHAEMLTGLREGAGAEGATETSQDVEGTSVQTFATEAQAFSAFELECYSVMAIASDTETTLFVSRRILQG